MDRVHDDFQGGNQRDQKEDEWIGPGGAGEVGASDAAAHSVEDCDGYDLEEVGH